MFEILSDEQISLALSQSGHTDEVYAEHQVIAKAQRDDTLRLVAEWGIEPCQEHYEGGGVISQRECPLCWQSLLEKP